MSSSSSDRKTIWQELDLDVPSGEGPDGDAQAVPDDADSGATQQPAALNRCRVQPRRDLAQSFDGLDYATWGNGHPPDPNGDVGPTYYIQAINTAIGIFDKSTGSKVAAFDFNAFMSQGNFGNLCDTDNFW